MGLFMHMNHSSISHGSHRILFPILVSSSRYIGRLVYEKILVSSVMWACLENVTSAGT
jgi:hypothetical protein